MRSIEKDLKQLKIGLLQLQRSALIDTQVLMQILLECDICNSDDIVDVRSRIEISSPEVKRIDEEIESLGGTVVNVPDTEKQKNVNEELQKLKSMLSDSDIEYVETILKGKFNETNN